MTTEARERCRIMGIEDKIRGEDERRTIVVVEMQGNGYSGDRDTGRWI